jgi:hypothetical protein
MAKKPLPRALAIRICRTVYELKADQLHWLGISDVCEAMKLKHTDELDEALEYASKEELLSCSPPPVHSVMLTHKGVMAVRGKIRRA